MTIVPNFETNIDGVKLMFRTNKFIELHYPEELEIELSTAKKIDQIIIERTNKEKYYLLVNFQNSYGSLSREVQQFYAKEAASIPQIKASSIVINNLPIRILAKFYIRFFRPDYPTRIFSDMELAREWLSDKYSTEHFNNSDEEYKTA